jgi:hypothetical protein
LGGVVKTYGGIGPNHFAGGVLIGDAGSFVDPLTGEGITQGMESALIAAPVLMDALEQGRFDKAFLGRFERDFRDYFDPSMRYLDLAATMTRNWHFKEFWMRATLRGFDVARADPDFARVAGSAFGGLNLRPLAVVEQIWSRIFAELGAGGARMVGDLMSGRGLGTGALAGDIAVMERAWEASIAADPAWHFSWLADVARKLVKLQATFWTEGNPRVRGPFI